MNNENRYLAEEGIFKEDAYLALASRFAERQEFELFYEELKDDHVKNEFLRAASTYLFFVKNGDWYVDVPRSNSVVDYFTNSFKLVGLIAVIESLSDKKFMDFYQWLVMQDSTLGIPIEDKKSLENLYNNYKEDYGSIRRCKSFFSELPSTMQKKLKKAIKIDGKPVESIEKVVEMLYRVRSSFAHDSKSALEISNRFVSVRYGKKDILWTMPMDLLLEAFEVGLLSHFRSQSNDFSNET